jgi:hypothetical protein
MRYKLAQDIFDSVAEELHIYSEEGVIDNSKFIKVIKACNAFLGLDINREGQTILDVQNYKARLPLDFTALNFAVLCSSKFVDQTQPSGFHVEQVDVPMNCSVDACGSDCGEFVVFQKCDKTFKEYTQTELVKVVNTPSSLLNNGCFNLGVTSINEISIKNGWIYTNFQSGTVYLNYVGDMVDDDGNLLVVDHDLINPYYEASCIYSFYRNLYSNHNGDELQRLQFWKEELRQAKFLAVGVRNMPEYNELTELFKHNRINYYNKYERYFKTRYYPY